MNQWTVANARQHFSALLAACHAGIQPIYRRQQLVAAVIDANTYQRLQQQQQRPSLAQAFQTLRHLSDAEEALPTTPRTTRANPFAENGAD